MPYLEMLAQQIGGQAAGNIVNEGMGILTQGIKNKQQLNQARKLQNMQLEGHYAQSQHDQKMYLDTLNKTNYNYQVEQLEKAGLNPALLYGMGGAGGATGGGTSGSPQGQSAGTAQRSGGAEGMGMQLPLMAAQIEVLKTQAEKNKAEADKTKGVDTTLAETQTQSLLQGIENQKVQKILTEVQDSLLRNELFEKYSTQDWRFQAAAAEAGEAISKAQSAMAQAGVDQATINEKIKLLKAQATGQVIQNTLTQAQTDKTKAETRKVSAEILKMANDIVLEWSKLTIEEKKVKLNAITQRMVAEQGWQGTNNMRLYYENEQKIIDYLDKLMGGGPKKP